MLLFLFRNCFYMYQCLIEDSRAIYLRISTYTMCLFYLSCIVIVLILVFIYLAYTRGSSVKVYFVGLSDERGRAGTLCFFLFHIPSIWRKRALQLERFLTAGFHHCRIIFFQVIPLYILLCNPTGCLLSSALTSEY